MIILFFTFENVQLSKYFNLRSWTWQRGRLDYEIKDNTDANPVLNKKEKMIKVKVINIKEILHFKK